MEFKVFIIHVPVNQQDSSPKRGLIAEHLEALYSTTRVRRETREGKLYPKIVRARNLFSLEGCPLSIKYRNLLAL